MGTFVIQNSWRHEEKLKIRLPWLVFSFSLSLSISTSTLTGSKIISLPPWHSFQSENQPSCCYSWPVWKTNKVITVQFNYLLERCNNSVDNCSAISLKNKSHGISALQVHFGKMGNLFFFFPRLMLMTLCGNSKSVAIAELITRSGCPLFFLRPNEFLNVSRSCISPFHFSLPPVG